MSEMSPNMVQPDHELTTPRRVMKGSTYIPCRHIRLNVRSVGSKADTSFVEGHDAGPTSHKARMH